MRELTEDVVNTRAAERALEAATWYVTTESVPTMKMTPIMQSKK